MKKSELERIKAIYTKLTNIQHDYSGTESEEEINLSRAVDSVKPSNTTNIYAYMGTYKYVNNKSTDESTKYIEICKYDDSANFSLYKSLEDEREEQKIKILDREEFEKNNIIINLPKVYFYNEYNYYILRMMYFKEVLENGQDYAKENIIRNQKDSKSYCLKRKKF